jgi:F-type H+-transporting ATPase subunit gamma
MELVAGSKMRRAVQNAQLLRSYALAAWKILQRIGLQAVEEHPFLKQRPLKRVLVVLLTSDRGLCGSLNANLCRAAERYVTKLHESGISGVDFVGVGR